MTYAEISRNVFFSCRSFFLISSYDGLYSLDIFSYKKKKKDESITVRKCR